MEKVIENEPKKVEIIWIDAVSDTSYLKFNAVDNLKAEVRVNIGFLIKEDEEKVIISSGIWAIDSLEADDSFIQERFIDGYFLIPRQMIKAIKVLVSEEKGCKQPEIVEGNGSTSPDSVTVGSDCMTWKG